MKFPRPRIHKPGPLRSRGYRIMNTLFISREGRFAGVLVSRQGLRNIVWLSSSRAAPYLKGGILKPV